MVNGESTTVIRKEKLTGAKPDRLMQELVRSKVLVVCAVTRAHRIKLDKGSLQFYFVF